MGRIVGAFAMSHQLGAPNDAGEQVFQGMREIGSRIRALNPDVLVIVTCDHLNNFSLTAPAPLAVGTAASFTPLGDMGLPRDPVPGAPAFAEGLLAHAATAGIALARAEPLRPDHGVMIPLGIVDPERRLAMVPLYVNTVFHPQPSPAEAAALGTLLADYVRHADGGDRVALLAAGGLSHWVGRPQEGMVNAAWDAQVIAAMAAGDVARLAGWSAEDILAVAGNGGLEISAWIAVLAAVQQVAPDACGECVFYEAMTSWATGMAGMAWELEDGK